MISQDHHHRRRRYTHTLPPRAAPSVLPPTPFHSPAHPYPAHRGSFPHVDQYTPRRRPPHLPTRTGPDPPGRLRLNVISNGWGKARRAGRFPLKWWINPTNSRTKTDQRMKHRGNGVILGTGGWGKRPFTSCATAGVFARVIETCQLLRCCSWKIDKLSPFFFRRKRGYIAQLTFDRFCVSTQENHKAFFQKYFFFPFLILDITNNWEIRSSVEVWHAYNTMAT